jgi:hypothetical protein
MRYGRFENNTLVEVYNTPMGVDIKDCFHAGITFVPIPPLADTGWYYNGNGDLIPPEPTPEPAPTE